MGVAEMIFLAGFYLMLVFCSFALVVLEWDFYKAQAKKRFSTNLFVSTLITVFLTGPFALIFCWRKE